MNKEHEEMFKRIDAQMAQLNAVARLKGLDKHDTLCIGRLRDAWCRCGATQLQQSIRRWEENR